MPLSLSLSPRYDLYRLLFDKTFLPEELYAKYSKLINADASVITTPIDYLNESIQAFEMPGISDLVAVQNQYSHNGSAVNSHKFNVEPKRENNYVSPANPLDLINKEIKVTFRMNHGFYNYFMLYETVFWKITKNPAVQPNDNLTVHILDELGSIISTIYFYDCLITGLDGLTFNYSKMERSTETFDLTLRFNNIDFEYTPSASTLE